MRKVKRRVLILMCCILGALILFPVEEKVRGVIALRSWEAQARATGVPLTVEDALLIFQSNRPATRLSPQQIQDRIPWAPMRSSHPSAMRMCAPGKARIVWKETKWRETDDLTNTWASIKPLSEEEEDRLAQARSDMAAGLFTANLDYKLGFNIMLPHLATLKGLANTFTTHVLTKLREKDLNAVQQDLLAMAALTDRMQGERLVICQLVRSAIGQISLAVLWEALQAEGWTDEQLASIQAAWSSQTFLSGMADALEMERIMIRDRLRTTSMSVGELRSALSMASVPGLTRSGDNGRPGVGLVGEGILQPLSDATETLRAQIFLVWWRFAWMEQDHLHGQKLLMAKVDAGRAAAREGNWREKSGLDGRSEDEEMLVGLMETRATNPKESTYDRVRFWLSSLSQASLLGAETKAAQEDAFRQLAVTVVAIERYRLRHQKLPASLADLVPDLLPAPPLDVMDAKPLRYRPGTNGTFLLYSVGKNGRDDGGDGRSTTPGNVSSYSTFGKDIVWPMPASPEEIQAADARRFGRR